MTINVKQETDGTFTISWDENDPKESILNNWTEEDFIQAICSHLEQIERELGAVDDKNQKILNEGAQQGQTFYVDQTEGEILQDLKNAEQFVQKQEEPQRLARLFF